MISKLNMGAWKGNGVFVQWERVFRRGKLELRGISLN